MGKVSPASGKAKAASIAVKVKRKAPKLADFESALAWLSDRTDVEKLSPSRVSHDTLKLERMRKLMSLLGDPHKLIRTVHVAGTKGKGSTCEMTAGCLEGCGYAVGIYTSPHLIDVRERIRINRRMIEHADFVAMAQRVADADAKLEEADGDATYFEIMTAMAMCYFADQAVDVAVIEVGLGGQLDSTNVITPEVSAISSISMDHMQILGDTIEKIAREKAGIFKPGVPAVVSMQKDSVLEVFREVAAQVGAPLEVVGKEIEFAVRFDPHGRDGPSTRVSVTSSAGFGYEHLPVPLKGEHQAHNCGLALAILCKLSERGFRVPETDVTRGLVTVTMPGRMELIKTSPRLLLDGAHNADSMKALMRGISSQIQPDSMVVIFGCAADKDIDGMLKELALGADKVIFTRSENVRAADPRDLARKFTEASGKMCQTAPDLTAAIELAKRAVGREDLICVTGSLYLVGEVKAMLKSRGK